MKLTIRAAKISVLLNDLYTANERYGRVHDVLNGNNVEVALGRGELVSVILSKRQWRVLREYYAVGDIQGRYQ